MDTRLQDESKYLKKAKLSERMKRKCVFWVVNNVFNTHSQIDGYKMVSKWIPDS